MIARSRRPASATASSTGAGIGSSPRAGRTSAVVSRPSAAASISAWVAPLVHSRPKLVGCTLSPLTRAITGAPLSGSATGLDRDPAAHPAVGARRPRQRGPSGHARRAPPPGCARCARRCVARWVLQAQEHEPGDERAHHVEPEEHPERIGGRLGVADVGGAQHDVDEHAAERADRTREPDQRPGHGARPGGLLLAAESSRPCALASKIDGIILYVDPLPRPDRMNSRMKPTT